MNSASYQVLTGEDSIGSIGSIGSSVEVEFPEKIQVPSSNFDSPGSSVTHNIGMRFDDKNDKNELRYKSVFDYRRSRGILYSIAVTTFCADDLFHY